MILAELVNSKLINIPNYILDNLCLLSYGGSISYGVNTQDSDIDLIGFYVPPTEYIYQTGIFGFDKQNIPAIFTVQHIIYNNKSYDITIYPIANIFKLASDGNPNILDFFMAERKYVIYSNAVGEYLLDNTKHFISKRCVARFLGFCTSELYTIKNGIEKWKSNDKDLVNGSRAYLYEKYGYDVKAAGNMLRLASSLDSILAFDSYCPSDCAEEIKKVRNGEYLFEDIYYVVLKWKLEIKDKEKASKLNENPDMSIIRDILLNCIDIMEYKIRL